MKSVLYILLMFISFPGFPGVDTASRDTDSRDDVIEAIVSHAIISLKERYQSDTYRFDVTLRWMPSQLSRLSPGDINVVIPKSGEPRGNSIFEVTARINGQLQSTDIQLHVKVERRLPTVAVTLRSGEEISSSDVILRWVDITRERYDLVEDPTELGGMRLRRTLVTGEPVRKSDLWQELTVEAGSVVILHFLSDGAAVQLQGIARQSGEMGEVIRIYSEATRRTYLGEVNGPGLVIWKQTL